MKETAMLHTLAIGFPLGRRQKYHDSGFVGCILEEISRLSEFYDDYRILNHLNGVRSWAYEMPKACALVFHAGRHPFRTKHVHVLYEDLGCNLQNVYVKGHEETHALEFFRRLRLLEKDMNSHGFRLKKNLRRMESETRAGIGGLYALLSMGHSPDDIRDSLPGHYSEELELFEFDELYF